MGRYQYTAENDDYEADLERIRISRKRRKARKRRAKRMAQLGRLSVRIVILVIAGWICLNLLRSNAVTAHTDGNESETTSLIANVEQQLFGFIEKETLVEKIPAPVSRTEEEVLEVLSDKAKTDAQYAYMIEHASEYPSAMLAALANNPEMLDFVSGYLEQTSVSSNASLTKKEKKETYPLLIQWDSRWGYIPYGSSNIGISGCGPTCLSMVIYALTRDASTTPAQVAAYAESAGYYIEGTGTAWALMTEGAAYFGITGIEMSLDEDVMKTRLDQGHPIICAMRPGDFTAAGHFIMIYGYEKDGFLINDPNCISRSRQVWDYNTLSSQIKDLWYFSYE